MTGYCGRLRLLMPDPLLNSIDHNHNNLKVAEFPKLA